MGIRSKSQLREQFVAQPSTEKSLFHGIDDIISNNMQDKIHKEKEKEMEDRFEILQEALSGDYESAWKHTLEKVLLKNQKKICSVFDWRELSLSLFHSRFFFDFISTKMIFEQFMHGT